VNGDSALLDVADLRTRYPVRRSIADRLARRPRQWVRAVDGVSFSLSRGEMVALVGESGCGKTTTAQTILRMVEANGGTITVDGQDITAMSQRRLRPLRRDIQMVYQDPYESLDPRFRVRQTVEEPLLVHGVGGSRRERDDLISAALERAGLAPASVYLNRYPHELSGGQRQRVAIAAALALDPVLLLADEPVSMLDVSVRAGILNVLRTARDELDLAAVYISHDLALIRYVCERTMVMYLGRVVEEGPTRELIGAPLHPYTRALVAAVPVPRVHQDRSALPIRGSVTETEETAGCPFRIRCLDAFARCAVETPALRDVAPGRRVACHLAVSA
jgi:oligopeptide/dipeptide ABC transporter ATP-binding protein